MKKVMIALFALVASLSVVSAGTISAIEYSVFQDNKVKIEKEDLPDAVKKTLDSDDYTGWEVSAAYMYNDKNTYEVELSDGTQTVSYKFGKDGKKIE